MDATKPRLGRGLDALIGNPTPPPAAAGGTHRLPLGEIRQNPFQPRKRFDDDELSQLKSSIQTHGVLQPLVVRKTADGFQLIAGERRLRAAEAAGLAEVPVHVVEFDDQQVFEAALVENIQRSDLNPIEKAQGFKDYLDKYKLTQDQLGGRLGLDRSTVSNLIGLLNLLPAVQDAVRLGQITMGHAKVLKGIVDPAKQAELCKQVILSGTSVHALEQQVKAMRNAPPEPAEPKPAAAAPPAKTPHVTGVENDLKQKLACRVEIKLKEKEKGQIVIAFENNDDFERIVAALQR